LISGARLAPLLEKQCENAPNHRWPGRYPSFMALHFEINEVSFVACTTVGWETAAAAAFRGVCFCFVGFFLPFTPAVRSPCPMTVLL
jgi:hypothetical protein